MNDLSSDSNDYLLKVKVQNNRIISLMRDRGIATISELSRVTKISAAVLHGLANMMASPFSHARSNKDKFTDGLWRKPVVELAEFFGVLPDEMFNEQQLRSPLKTNATEKAVKQKDILAFMPQLQELPEPDAAYIEDMKVNVLNETLAALNPREQKVINMRYGLNGEEPNYLETIAVAMDLSRERIRQIEGKALRKLRRPKRNEKLVEILKEDEPSEDRKVFFYLAMLLNIRKTNGYLRWMND